MTKPKKAKKAAAKPTASSKPTVEDSTKPTFEDSTKDLTAKQRVFALEYLGNGFNATRAAIAAGYSARTADTQGSRLLKNVKVAAAIAELSRKKMASRQITAERVLDEIAKLAFLDPRRLYNQYGSLIPVHELDEDVAAAIAGIDVKELYAEGEAVGELKKIKFADKGQNLERLGRYLKLFKDGPSGTQDDPFIVRIDSILGRKGEA